MDQGHSCTLCDKESDAVDCVLCSACCAPCVTKRTPRTTFNTSTDAVLLIILSPIRATGKQTLIHSVTEVKTSRSPDNLVYSTVHTLHIV